MPAKFRVLESMIKIILLGMLLLEAFAGIGRWLDLVVAGTAHRQSWRRSSVCGARGLC